MKIQSLNTQYKQNTNFGYNAEYHKNIQSKLKKENSPIANYLLEMDRMSLDIEDKLISMEKDKTSRKVLYNDLSLMLTEVKIKTTYLMVTFFSKYNYADNMTLQYYQESMNTKNNKAALWRFQFSQLASNYALTDYSALFDLNEDEVEFLNQLDEEKNSAAKICTTAQIKETPQTADKAADKTVDNPVKEIVEILTLEKSTPYSPKGFADVSGMEKIKERLKDELIDYIKNPKQAQADYEDYQIRAPRGYLFYGPPGCGKTFLTKALAEEAGVAMYKMDVSKLGSMYVNQTSKNIEKAFTNLALLTKKINKPVILFMDEADSLAINRAGSQGASAENLKTTATLLKMIEEARDNNIVVIAATNKYNMLDDAFKSRFDGHIYFPLPDKEQIQNLVKSSLEKRKKGQTLASDPKSIEEISGLMKGYSNRTIIFILDEAGKRAKKVGRRDISIQDIKTAIKEADYEKNNPKEYEKKKNNNIGFSFFKDKNIIIN